MLAGLLAAGLVGYHHSSSKLFELTLESLKQRVNSYKPLIQLSDAESIQLANEQMQLFRMKAQKEISFSTEKVKKVLGKNQVTQKEETLSIPEVLIRGLPLVDHAYVDEIASLYGQEVTLFAMTEAGLYRVSTTVRNNEGQRAVGTFIPKDSAVFKAIEKGNSFVGRALVIGQDFMTTYDPLIVDGKVMGAVFLGKPDRVMAKVLDYIKNEKVASTGYIFVLNSRGEMVLHPTLKGKNVLETKDEDGKFLFRDIIQAKSGVIKYSWKNAQTQEAELIYAFHSYLPELDWHIVARVTQSEVESELNSLKWTLAILISVLLVAMLSLTTFFGVWISKRLSKVAEELGKSSVSLNSSSTDLAKQSDQLANMSAQAAASIEESVASLEEIKSQVVTNSHSTREASALGAQALDVTRNGSQKMEEVREIMHRIEKDSLVIQEMSQIIDDIAFQTNLLSLNASVEAARAGEAGRGFSVVAEAVRSLANRAADSAKKISDRTRESHTTIRLGVERVQESEGSLKEILKNVESLSSLIKAISVASEEQAKGVEQIAMGMNQLDQATQSNAAVAEEISASSSQLKVENDVLEGSVKDLLVLVHGEQNKAA